MTNTISSLLRPVSTYFDLTVRAPYKTLKTHAQKQMRPVGLRSDAPLYLIDVAKKQRKMVSPEPLGHVNVVGGSSFYLGEMQPTRFRIER